ncbi:uncharacterized protein LOC127535096 [Acanthochromis polyacanthus]|uniref:uncharacterized protein LOC127535096 n=1 Tax=Acanthochromis polyacanthus TaxID=80966 RepID=UPI0022345FE3|nr:uncharacterized protein LOC127535096 [Acanthochromis polyacanthus]
MDPENSLSRPDWLTPPDIRQVHQTFRQLTVKYQKILSQLTVLTGQVSQVAPDPALLVQYNQAFQDVAATKAQLNLNIAQLTQVSSSAAQPAPSSPPPAPGPANTQTLTDDTSSPFWGTRLALKPPSRKQHVPRRGNTQSPPIVEPAFERPGCLGHHTRRCRGSRDLAPSPPLSDPPPVVHMSSVLLTSAPQNRTPTSALQNRTSVPLNQTQTQDTPWDIFSSCDEHSVYFNTLYELWEKWREDPQDATITLGRKLASQRPGLASHLPDYIRDFLSAPLSEPPTGSPSSQPGPVSLPSTDPPAKRPGRRRREARRHRGPPAPVSAEDDDAPPPVPAEVDDAPPPVPAEVDDAPPPVPAEVDDAPPPVPAEVDDAPPPVPAEVDDAPPPVPAVDFGSRRKA